MDSFVQSDLIAIGYWQSDEDASLPHPSQFVGAALSEKLRDKLCGYLESGVEFMAFLGYSHCRFQCGVPDRAMGCRDLVDGSWMWPEGLSHYVRAHHVILPERFVQHAAHSGWKVRPVPRPTLVELADGSHRIPVNYDFWKAYQRAK